ncbi:MAG: hypothetical protein MUF58_20925 [Arcicella sp.]|nr:hypothetical protein [Arcicella sp.]
MEEADSYFAKGNYHRAKNLFDYCSKLPHPNNKEALRRKDQAVTLLLHQDVAKTKMEEGDYFSAKKELYLILKNNPNDVAAKYDLDKISHSPNQVATNTSPKVDIKKPSIPSYKPSNTQPLPKPTYSETEQERQAAVDAERKRLKKLKEQREIDSLFIIASNLYSNCRYSDALPYFNKIIQKRPNAPKSNQKVRDIQSIQKYENEIIKLKNNNPTNSFEDIAISYERILEKNRKCTKYKNEYYNFVYNQVIYKTDKYSCQQNEKYRTKLYDIDASRLVKDNQLNQLFSSCKQIDTLCSSNISFIARLLKSAQKQTGEDLDQTLNDLRKDLSKIKECNENEYSKFDKEVNALILKESERKTKAKCTDEQLALINKSDELSDIECKTSYEILQKIDTLCLDISTKKVLGQKVKIVKYCWQNSLMKMYEDTASRSRKLGFYKDEQFFLKQALEYASSKNDSTRINYLLKMNSCKIENNGKCPEKEFQNRLSCKDSSVVSLWNLSGSLGYDINNLNILGFGADYWINNTTANIKMNNNVVVGLKIENYRFKKLFDYRLLLTYSTKKFNFDNLRINNQFYTSPTTIMKAQAHHILIYNELKWHKKGICPNNWRKYISTGLATGYSQPSQVSTILNDTDINNKLSNVLGGISIVFGIEKPLPEMFSFELFYNRLGSIYNITDKKIDNPFNAKFTQGNIGLRLNIGIMKIKQNTTKND